MLQISVVFEISVLIVYSPQLFLLVEEKRCFSVESDLHVSKIQLNGSRRKCRAIKSTHNIYFY